MHKDSEVNNLSAFIYRLFYESFSSIVGTNMHSLTRNLHETVFN